MAISHYPNGFANGVTVRGMPVLNSYPGAVFWVDSVNGSDGNRGTFDRPFASIDFAIGQCTPSRGDVIVCKAFHAETLTAAGAIALDVAGVAIVGLGEGSGRPTLTFSTATSASVLVTAASCSIENIVGITGINALTNPFNIQAADFYGDIEWRDPTTILEAARVVLGNASADRLKLKVKHLGQTGGSSCVNSVRLVGTDSGDIETYFYGKASTSVVEFLTTASTNVNITGYMYNSGTTNGTKNVVDTVGGSTWFASFSDGSAGAAVTGGSGMPASISASSLQEKVAQKTAATMVNGQVIFTVAGGPIQIVALESVCVTANDATASTLQYSATPTIGSAQTISAASASLANAAAGASVTLPGTALSTAALLNANGPNLIANPGTIVVPAGTITMVIGIGSTTGTWTHYIRYRALATGVTVS